MGNPRDDDGRSEGPPCGPRFGLNPFMPPPFLGPFPEYVLHPEVSGCAWYDYLKCAALIAGAGAACYATGSPRLCFEAVGAAIAAGCWDCLPGSVQDVACLICRQNPLICPRGVAIRCGAGESPCCCDGRRRDCRGDGRGRDEGDRRESGGDCGCRGRRPCGGSASVQQGAPGWEQLNPWMWLGSWAWPGSDGWMGRGG